ncbi:MAG: hypothetical protein LBU21_09050 [Treponema sp.]|jgi:hypothetical protein|nr:hypothetical protein [Treponema sp.]
MKGPLRFTALLPVLISVVLSALLSGCLTLTDRVGAFLEGKRDRVVARYRSPPTVPTGQGVQVLELGEGGGLDIRIEAFPVLSLRASTPGEGGLFELRSLHYLAGSPQGWVEFSLELVGEGEFIPEQGELRLSSRPEPVGILGGKIRWKDTRLSGEDARRALNNRYERIRALAAWMGEQEAPESLSGNARDFYAYWKPRLLPELVPRAERPWNYAEGGPRVTAEQVAWNTDYTRVLLPEELWPLRDSGTLKRDWEECGEWIFLEYAWESVFAALENGGVIVMKE